MFLFKSYCQISRHKLLCQYSDKEQCCKRDQSITYFMFFNNPSVFREALYQSYYFFYGNQMMPIVITKLLVNHIL